MPQNFQKLAPLFLLARTLEHMADQEDDPQFAAQSRLEARALRKRAFQKGALAIKTQSELV